MKGGNKFSGADLRLRRFKLSSASQNESSSVELDVPFPGDYDELLEQVSMLILGPVYLIQLLFWVQISRCKSLNPSPYFMSPLF